MNDSVRTRPRAGLLTFVWLWVGIPFGYGVYQLATQVVQLFTG
ncbi:hypothetical protein EV191_110132 [Tamaricihabitans halophyticus]|uniref:Uncharacterized protein n=1 Tax=Tamaricihabitans halophyticus TaxID=1262583 RepID=A0A4R2QH39_9PSEU|nr:hypothetical protein [Tamaricihabitans halophyticus]TCP48572.1 hypothetical protein EV191_110132 [Tamaricihabitans halophyticus]